MDQILSDVRNSLYQRQRLEARFWFFENVLVPSLKSQNDPDFQFVILTSPELPDEYKNRLATAVADLPQATILISQQRSVVAAVKPLLQEVFEADGTAPIQFRVDDDDCLAINFVKDLRKSSIRLAGINTFAVTMPKSLVVTGYSGETVKYYSWFHMFHSVGCAMYSHDVSKNIFSFGHNTLHKRMPAISIPGFYSAMHCKFDGHDTKKFPENNVQKNNSELISREAFGEVLARRFPFLSNIDFEAVKAMNFAG